MARRETTDSTRAARPDSLLSAEAFAALDACPVMESDRWTPAELEALQKYGATRSPHDLAAVWQQIFGRPRTYHAIERQVQRYGVRRRR